MAGGALRAEEEAIRDADGGVVGQARLRGWLGRIVFAASVALPVVTLLVAFTGWFDTLTRRAGHLAVAIPLVFLLYPARRSAGVSLVDKLCALAALVSFGWVVVEHERIVWRLVYVDPLSAADFTFGAMAILLTLEAVRRTLGWTLVVTAAVFIGYALVGPWMPGILEHKGVTLDLLVEHLYLVPEGLFNMVTGVMATYLLLFLVLAALLRAAGGERLFLEMVEPIARMWVGGAAKVSVLGSAAMGTVSGSTVANVVTTGSVTIPLMKRAGFLPHEAAAIETAAGTGGSIMPPIMGAGVFVMAEITGIPLATILGYSVLPAVLYFGSVYAYVHVKAQMRSAGVPDRASLGAVVPILRRTAVQGFHLAIPMALLLALLFLDYSPFYASACAVVAMVVVSALRRQSRIAPARLLEVFGATTREVVALSATMASAALIVGVISLTGLMLKTTSLVVGLAGGALLPALLLVALISLVLGTGLPVTSTYIILATVAAPALSELGLSLLAAHLIIYWFSQTATITPPVCLTAFVAAQIAQASPMRTGLEALRIGIGLYLVPFMFAYSSLLSGNRWAMTADAAAGLMFLALVPVVTEGFYRAPLGAAARATAAAAAACFFVTASTTDVRTSLAFLAVGLAILCALAFAHSRRPVPPAAAPLVPGPRSESRT